MIKIFYLMLILWSSAEDIKPMMIDSSPHNSYSKIRTLLFGQTKADFYLFSTSAYPEGKLEMIYGQIIDGACKVGKTVIAFEDYSEDKYMRFVLLDDKKVKKTITNSPLISIDLELYKKIQQTILDHSQSATYNKENARRFSEPVLDGPAVIEIYSQPSHTIFLRK